MFHTIKIAITVISVIVVMTSLVGGDMTGAINFVFIHILAILLISIIEAMSKATTEVE